MTAALADFFKDRPQVKAAFLAALRVIGEEEVPHLIIGLDVEGDLKNITSEVGPFIDGFLKIGDKLDFIQIDHKSDVSEYLLNETDPFYKK